jgi:hypothetical protein
MCSGQIFFDKDLLQEQALFQNVDYRTLLEKSSFERFVELFFKKLFMAANQVVMSEFIHSDGHHGDVAFLEQ